LFGHCHQARFTERHASIAQVLDQVNKRARDRKIGRSSLMRELITEALGFKQKS
jgi:hypothetical protein